MKFWQMVTWAETGHYCEIARIAEELGFHGVMNAAAVFRSVRRMLSNFRRRSESLIIKRF